MITIFCPTCETYLPPGMAFCPTCGQPRLVVASSQVAWTAKLDEVPAGPALRVGDYLWLPSHDPGQPPRQASLHRLSLNGTLPGQVQVFEDVLISGVLTTQTSEIFTQHPSEPSLVVATYSSEPMANTASLIALDQAGQERWRWMPGVQAVSAPALAGEKVWGTSNTGLLVALNLTDGAVQVQLGFGLTPSRAAPLVQADVAFIPNRGPRLLALGLDGQRCWQFDTGTGWLDQTPCLANGRLWVVVNLTGLILALDSASGQVVRQIELGPQIGKRLSPPTADDERLYVGAGNGLYAFDLDQGQQLWHFPTERRIEAAPTVIGGVVYVAAHDHHLYVLEADTGRELWRYQAAARLEVAPLVTSGQPPLVLIADHSGQVTALSRSLRPGEAEAAGQWLAAAEGYAAQGELGRAAELLQLHDEPFKAAQLWQAAGEVTQAAIQYELAGCWFQAAELWGRLGQPLRRAKALTQYAPSLVEAEAQAQVWSEAAALFQGEGQTERATTYQHEVARCRQQPLFVVEIQAMDGLVQQTYARVSFTVYNQGFGPAQKLIIRVTNKEMFAGPLAETRQIKTLRVGQTSREELSVKPLEVGHVPLQFNLSYLDQHGQMHSQDYPPLYLVVARVEAERSPGPVYHIYTGGGAYIEGDVTTGGDFVGRDQARDRATR